jgi:hypothetical protein
MKHRFQHEHDTNRYAMAGLPEKSGTTVSIFAMIYLSTVR